MTLSSLSCWVFCLPVTFMPAMAYKTKWDKLSYEHDWDSTAALVVVLSPCHLWSQDQESSYNHIDINIHQQLLDYLFHLYLPHSRSSTGRNKTVHMNSRRVNNFNSMLKLTGNRKRCFKLLLALEKLVSSPRIPPLPHYFLSILFSSYLHCVRNTSEAQMSSFWTWIKNKKDSVSAYQVLLFLPS